MLHSRVFSIAEAREILQQRFGVTGEEILPLPSERDQNFRVGSRYVLKISNAAESRAMLEAENAALERLGGTGMCPRVIPGRADGEAIGEVRGRLVRLLTLLPGQPVGERKRQTAALRREIGATLAGIQQALEGFDHPALHRDFHWDLANAPRVLDEHRGKIRDAATGGWIDALRRVYEEHAAPLLPRLRRSAIHNDGNDFNILTDGERVTGWIDFGDMVYTHTLNDLAVAMAYAGLGMPDPVAAMLDVVRGYHGVRPLPEDELPALYSLACIRLCMSACIAARQQAERPDDAYLGISQQPIRAALPVLAGTHPRLAWYRIREACGLDPVPEARRVVAWLRAQPEFAALLGEGRRSTPLELSVESPLVSSDAARNAPGPLARRLAERIAAAGADYGVGGYGECRVLYTTEAFAGAASERRTLHLGIDCTAGAGTPIYAPLDGVVHGFEDADAPLDYGPVVVLRHDAGGTPFYTLYGHLSRQSLEGLTPGQKIRRGARIGTLGEPHENGGWWPHVHFQVIVDLLDVPCNYNGTALPSQRATWLSLCPDPNLILRVPQPEPRAGAQSIAAARREHLGGNLSVAYGRQPVHAVRGWMQYLYDADGRRYLDAYNNVPHVGHGHPRVVEAVSEQLALLNTNTRYLQRQLTDYAEALTRTLPAPLTVCFFTASGSEANELALRLARAYTGARDLLVLDAAYHGHTTTLIDISPYKHDGPGGAGAPDWVHKTPIPDVFRGEFRAGDPEAGRKYAARVGEAIDRLGGRRLCGYIAETCPSVAGQILLPEGYLAEVYRRVRAAGGVAIADEVQTGFGRLGTHFWGFEGHGVVPDIVVLGKPIANGYPLGAVVCRREIAAAFDNGMEFFSTFGGSTAALAAAHATLRVTLEEGLQTRALAVGEELLGGLRALAARYRQIGDVRGSGLFAGVEFVRGGIEPDAEAAAYVALRMREEGILLGTDGPWHNVVKIRGPLALREEDARELVESFGRILEELPAR